MKNNYIANIIILLALSALADGSSELNTNSDQYYWSFDNDFQGWERTGSVPPWHTMESAIQWYDQWGGAQGVIVIDACESSPSGYQAVHAKGGINKSVLLPKDADEAIFSIVRAGHDGGIRFLLKDLEGQHVLGEEVLSGTIIKTVAYDISAWRGKSVLLEVQTFGAGTDDSGCVGSSHGCGPCCGEYVGIDKIEITSVGRYTLDFEGKDFDKEGELLILINGNRLQHIPLSSPDQWMSYSMDITDLIAEDNTRNLVTIYNGMMNSDPSSEQIKGISIVKNGRIIHRYIPDMAVKVDMIEFDFNPSWEPVTSTYSGPVTIEMYAPQELMRGEQNSVKIEVKSLRMRSLDDCQKSITDREECDILGMPVYSGITKGDIRICYSEAVNIDLDPVLLLRHVDEDWGTYNKFVPDDPCTPIEGLVGGVLIGLIGEVPGLGFAMSVADGISSCEFPYDSNEPYLSGPPQSDVWKNINEYDIFDLVYAAKYPHILADKIEAIYPLTFNDPGEYEINAFIDCHLEEDHGLGPVPHARIGKELSTKIKVK
jgi:hypothetical protein